MLERLHVVNLGIIREVELSLGPGLTVLTGETGAGKSLLVGSLKLLGGGRAASDLVRSGADSLRVEATFRLARDHPACAPLESLGVSMDENAELVVRREVTAQGRSRAWLNDVSVTASGLQTVASWLLAVHGQHEQHGLADPSVQRRMVDDFAGHDGLLEKVAEAFSQWEAAEAERQRLEAARAARRDRLDAIAFQLGEIERVGPEPGEDEALVGHRSVLQHSVRLGELGAALLERLGEGGRPLVNELARAKREAEEMAGLGLQVESVVEAVTEAGVLVEEALREVQEAVAGLDHDPGALDELESRLHALETLMLKYGSPLEAVLEHRDGLLRERAELEALGENLEGARERATAALAAYDAVAAQLQRSREEAGRALLRAVSSILADLAMAGTRLEFSWQARSQAGSPLRRGDTAVAFDESGVEMCDLLIAANRGEDLRPMARIASGGELSRLHLALRTALRRRRGEAPMALLFDEVDSGLGGATADALGALLKDLSGADQLLVVTHLPQVAAHAREHFRVEKVERSGRTVTRVDRLTGRGRQEELARMMSGDSVTESALAHARSLIEERE